MTDKEIHRYSMYLAVNDFLSQNTPVISPLPNFTPIFTDFQNSIKKIQDLRGVQELDKTGITANKNALREELIRKVTDILRKMEAYAVISSNVQLENEVHYSESKLRGIADSILKDICLVIHEKASGNLGELNTYGISEDDLTAFMTEITNFGQAIPKPRLGKVAGKGATSGLKDVFSTGDTCLSKMDALVEIVRETQPDFYKGYKNSRIVIDTGGRLVLKGIAVEKSTGEPMKGVTFSFENSDPASLAISTNGPIVKKTHKKGRFYIRSIEKGTYAVTVTKVGYKKQLLTINVPEGEMTDMVAEMEKE